MHISVLTLNFTPQCSSKNTWRIFGLNPVIPSVHKFGQIHVESLAFVFDYFLDTKHYRETFFWIIRM